MNDGLSTPLCPRQLAARPARLTARPIYTTTTFKLPSTAALLDVVEGRKAGALYTRYGLNPTIQALEGKLAAFEGAEAALAFASGMAAESTLFLIDPPNAYTRGGRYSGWIVQWRLSYFPCHPCACDNAPHRRWHSSS